MITPATAKLSATTTPVAAAAVCRQTQPRQAKPNRLRAEVVGLRAAGSSKQGAVPRTPVVASGGLRHFVFRARSFLSVWFAVLLLALQNALLALQGMYVVRAFNSGELASQSRDARDELVEQLCCMYVFNICTPGGMYVCMYACMHGRTHLSISVPSDVYIHPCIYLSIYPSQALTAIEAWWTCAYASCFLLSPELLVDRHSRLMPLPALLSVSAVAAARRPTCVRSPKRCGVPMNFLDVRTGDRNEPAVRVVEN
jgi:hypothetical protein